MRVLYVTRGYTAHDARFLAKLAETGNAIGYVRLEAASPGDDPYPLPAGIQRLEIGAAVTRGAWMDYPALRGRLRKVIDSFAPDVVHAGPVQQGAFLAAWAGIRTLVTMSWGSDILRDARRGVGRLMARFTLKRSAAFVCDCQAVREAAIGLGAPTDRIVVFPWGVDLQRFTPGDGSALRRRLGWERAFVLLSTRSWEPLYGLDVLVDGFVQAASRDARLRLLVLGGGSLEPWIRRRVRDSGLDDRVHFAGRVGLDDLPAYYRSSDLYLSASRSDGTSVSLLEAMACGLPVVVSDIAGNREWVTQGENGWLFPVGDSAALADRILFAGKANLAEYAKRSRAVAERRADWDRNFPLLLDAYRIAINEGRVR